MDNGHKNGHHKPVIPAQAGIQMGGRAGFPPLGGGNVRRTKGAQLAHLNSSSQGDPQFPSPSMGEGQGEGERGGQGAAGSGKTPNLDVDAARASMTRMANIFADIAKHAEESTQGRCPYKDAKSHCTAKFGCDNQHFTKNPLDLPICTARDGDLDYRSAWQI